LSLSEVDRLLQTAAEHGVRRVDTAPLYGDSQKLLGSVLKDYPCFLVSSKVGRPNFSDFNPQGIRKSVELTLKDLGISQLDTLFVHSLPKSYLESQNLVVLEEIRRSGVVNRIGFSGDNEDLRAASSLEFFSCLMFSLNPLDLSNLKFLNENSKNPPQLYLKRVLANGVYNIHLERELRNFLRVISKKPTFTAHAEYKRRYRVL
jgi:aryl-alcohol dehydrogenase-like predicted oxidoreductase